MKTRYTNHTEPPADMPSIEIRVFHDADIARMDFEDNFNVIEHNSYSKTFTVIYEDDAPDSVAELFDFTGITEKDFRNAMWSYVSSQEYSSGYRHTMRDFIAEYGGYDWRDAFIEMLEQYSSIYEYAKEETLDLLENLAGFKELYTVFSSTGYSQGDYCNVLVKNTTLAEFKDSESFQSMVNNLIWDSPIYARLEVDGEEHYLEEHLTDGYRWNKEEVMTGLADLDFTPEVLTAIEELMPTEANYI